MGALLSVSSALQAPPLHAKRAAPLQSTIDRAANREQTDAVGRYCADDKQPQRRATSTVKVGQVRIGSSDPIVLQTMGTTDTNDVQASVEQILRCKEAGADMVRLTVQGIGEAKNSLKIREQLDAQGVHIPLVADMHFNRKAAMIACEAYDKIRVNPGNFADGRKTFEEIDYDVACGVRCYSTRGDGVRVGHVPDFAVSCRDAASVASGATDTLSPRPDTHTRVTSRRWRRLDGVEADAVGARATRHTVAINTGPAAVRGRARLHRADVHAACRKVQGARTSN